MLRWEQWELVIEAAHRALRPKFGCSLEAKKNKKIEA